MTPLALVPDTPEITTTAALLRALALFHPPTHRHCLRVAHLAVEIGQQLGWADRDLADLDCAGRLHDLGKLVVPVAWLDRDGPLSAAEYRRVQEHVSAGTDLLEGVVDPQVLAIIAAHHERWDGTGYPHRLAQAQIVPGARILCVADCLDAMMHRARGRSWAHAVAEVRALSGTQFAPEVAAAVAALPRRAVRLAA